MNFSSQIGQRLLNERKRLGISQAEAGRSCGVSREMWGKYERGLAVMGTEVLSKFAALGADVLYVLTDQRTLKTVREGVFESDSKRSAPSVLPPVDNTNQPAQVALTPREEALLDNYRHSPEDGKRAVETTASALAKQASLGCVANGHRKK